MSKSLVENLSQNSTQNLTRENLEIALNGKRYNISLDMLHHEVRDELRELFKKEVEPLMLLKLYITKAQEYAALSHSVEALYKSVEGKISESSQANSSGVKIEVV